MNQPEIKVAVVYKIKITKCSFNFMWYNGNIGLVMECIHVPKMIHSLLFVDAFMLGIDIVQNRTPWVLEGDYEILDKETKPVDMSVFSQDVKHFHSVSGGQK